MVINSAQTVRTWVHQTKTLPQEPNLCCQDVLWLKQAFPTAGSLKSQPNQNYLRHWDKCLRTCCYAQNTAFLRRKHPQVRTKRKSYQKLFSKHAIKEESAKVHILETGNESSSNKDLHSFVEEERCFSNPNRMNKKHSKCAFIRQTGGYINA